MLQTYRAEPFCDKPLVISVIKSDSKCKVVSEWGISGWGPPPKSPILYPRANFQIEKKWIMIYFEKENPFFKFNNNNNNIIIISMITMILSHK